MRKLTTYQMTTCAIMAALLCVLCPFTIPVGPIPISLATLIIYIATYLLGGVLSMISVLVYILLGAVGLPVFSGGAAGLQQLAGPTGGYIIGYAILALVAGLIIERSNARLVWSVIGLVVGTAVLYLFGTVWFVILMQCDVAYALSVCVVPFLLGDTIKIVVATILGKSVRAALNKSGLLPTA